MNIEDVKKRVNELLVEEFELEESEFDPNSNLKEALDIDSLDFIDLVVIIEKNFGFKLQSEDLIKMNTLNDFYTCVSEKATKMEG